jgi:hypothetical protein
VPVLPWGAPGALERAQALEAVRWKPRAGRWQPARAWLCPTCASREYLLPPDGLPLRDYLARPGAAAYVAVADASGMLAESLGTTVTGHVLDVVRQVELQATVANNKTGLLLAALLHHERPEKTYDILQAAGLVDQAPFVADMLVGLGALGRLEGERAFGEYLRLHGHLLADLLLLEAAHEGHAGERVREAARRAGVRELAG